MTKRKEDEEDTVKEMQNKKKGKWSIAYRLNLWPNKNSFGFLIIIIQYTLFYIYYKSWI